MMAIGIKMIPGRVINPKKSQGLKRDVPGSESIEGDHQ